MLDSKVIDSVEVVKNAIRDGVSIGSMFLTT